MTKTGTHRASRPARFLGVDLGAETMKLVELGQDQGKLSVVRREIIEHGKKPGQRLRDLLQDWDWPGVSGATVSGRFSSQVNLPGIPAKQALLRGYRFLYGNEPATIVNIGSHGFTVLEVRDNGLTVFRENSRCSQGTGNFLRQLVERFSLTVEEASTLCADVPNPAPLSGRCPVILKTDMTHLANKGEDRARILAGLFDAVCENVLVLVKPARCRDTAAPAGGAPEAEAEPAPGRTALAVLVVDDESVLRQVLAEAIGECYGCKVYEAADGLEAIEVFQAHRDEIGLVLTDCVMPRMRGPEAFDEMRRIRPGIPGILMSGFSEEIGVELATRHGFASLLKKPFRFKVLSDLMAELQFGSGGSGSPQDPSSSGNHDK